MPIFQNAFTSPRNFGASQLPTVPENQSEGETANNEFASNQFSSLPFEPGFTTATPVVPSPPAAQVADTPVNQTDILQPEKVYSIAPPPPPPSLPATSSSSRRTPSPPTQSKPVVFDNPWDLVPDQPINNNTNKNLSNCDSSSGISSTSSSYVVKPGGGVSGQMDQAVVNGNGNKWLDEISDSLSHLQPPSSSDNNKKILSLNNGDDHSQTVAGILDDPFDAEWAALATRDTSRTCNNMNPFTTTTTMTTPDPSTSSHDSNNVHKTFELQM